jgi:DNA-binding Lrp family transcriptional regulator
VLSNICAITPKKGRFFHMDKIDKKILAELQADGRLSVTELAHKVGLSLSPVTAESKP